MSRVADQLSVETGVVAGLTHDGRGVVRTAARTVFVDGALPGETVRYRTLRRRRKHLEAELECVLEPCGERVEPRCRYFGVCGGCVLQHLSADAQRDMKQQTLLDALQRIGGLSPRHVLAPLAEAGWGYRRRARLALRDVAGKDRVLVGFRERGKSYVTDMRSCEILAPPLGDLIAPLSELVGALSVRRRLPQIEVARGDNGTALVFRVLDAPSEDDLGQLRAFAVRHDVDVYLQPGGLDSVTALHVERRPLHYALPRFGLEIEFEPTDFVQIHAGVNEIMVDRAVELLAPGPHDAILDLFCGLGNFSLALARSAAHVVGVEGDPALVERARTNAVRNAIANAEFHVADLFADWHPLAWAQRPCDGLLLDPPRAGAAAVVARIGQLGPRRIVYVSCNPATLARDAAALVADHGYRLSAAGIIDMFPHTAHVESIALFEKRAGTAQAGGR